MLDGVVLARHDPAGCHVGGLEAGIDPELERVGAAAIDGRSFEVSETQSGLGFAGGASAFYLIFGLASVREAGRIRLPSLPGCSRAHSRTPRAMVAR